MHYFTQWKLHQVQWTRLEIQSLTPIFLAVYWKSWENKYTTGHENWNARKNWIVWGEFIIILSILCIICTLIQFIYQSNYYNFLESYPVFLANYIQIPARWNGSISYVNLPFHSFSYLYHSIPWYTLPVPYQEIKIFKARVQLGTSNCNRILLILVQIHSCLKHRKNRAKEVSSNSTVSDIASNTRQS